VQRTTVDAGDTGVELVETDTWVAGGTTVDTTYALTGPAGTTVRLYHAGDCYVDNDDLGTGGFSSGSATCVHDNGGGTAQPLTFSSSSPQTSAVEEHYSDVWSDIANQGPFGDTCDCGDEEDNGLGLSWPIALSGSTPVTVQSRLTLGSR